MSWILLAGIVSVLIGGAVSTITVEAAPGKPQKRPLTPGQRRAANASAFILITLGLMLAGYGGISLIVEELNR